MWLVAPPNGAVAEWSKAHAWKVCKGPKLFVGSNPTRSANSPAVLNEPPMRGRTKDGRAIDG